MMEKTEIVISDEEQIARIISREWMADGILLPMAFALKLNETYLSVNRLCVESYDEDVKHFVDSHESYQTSSGDTYFRALLDVGNVRSVKVFNEGKPIEITVEVEPRDLHIKSHAGIFVKTEGKNIVLGKRSVGDALPEGISSEFVLQKVRWELLDLAVLQKCKL